MGFAGFLSDQVIEQGVFGLGNLLLLEYGRSPLYGREQTPLGFLVHVYGGHAAHDRTFVFFC